MRKLLLTTAITVAMGSSAAFAHHPAEDIVDPEIYAMIDENVADTPHADLTFDDMGSDTLDTADTTDVTGGNVDEVGAMADASVDMAAAADMADIEPAGSGQMGSQR